MIEEEPVVELAPDVQTVAPQESEVAVTTPWLDAIPQYARFVFLQQAWRTVVSDGDTTWIQSMIAYAEQNPAGPGASAGVILKRLLALGVAAEEITELVRVMQWQVLAGLMETLADPTVAGYPDDQLPQVSWALFETDEEGEPLQPIEGVAESLLETDPSGRQMRPRNQLQQ